MAVGNKVNITFTGDSKSLNKTLTTLGNRLNKLDSGTKRANKSFSAFAGTGSRIKQAFLALGIGGLARGLWRAGKEVLTFDYRMGRLAAQSRKRGQSITDIKKRMDELKTSMEAQAAITGISKDEQLSAIEAIVERTGDLKLAVESLPELTIVSRATGASMGEIGATAANLSQKMGVTKQEILEVFDVLSSQGKEGAFTLQNMAGLFERLLSAAGRMDVQTIEGIRKFGAFIQVARRGVGTSEQAATAVERVISEVISKAAELQGVGVQIYDPDKISKDGRKVYRDVSDILQDIIKLANADAEVLTKIFGDEAIRAVTPLAQVFKKAGTFEEVERLAELGGKGVEIRTDYELVMSYDKAEFDKTQAAFDKLKDRTLTPIVQEAGNLAGAINRAADNADRLQKTFGKMRLPTIGKEAEDVYTMGALPDRELRRRGITPVDIGETMPGDVIFNIETRKRVVVPAPQVSTPNLSQPQVQNEINLNVRIDPNNRVLSETSSPNTRINTTVDRGALINAK